MRNEEKIDIESALIEIPDNDYNKLNPLVSCFEQKELLFGDFFNNFLLRNIPCLIRNITCDWECALKWVVNDNINYDYISKTYGSLEAPVADCNNIEYNAHCKSNMTVNEFIQYLKIQDDRLLYLKDWHLRRTRPDDNFYEIPSFFVLDWLNEYATDNNEDDFMFVYIGPKGSWTPLHEDVYRSYSWSVNVAGRKKWILFPPGEEIKLKDKLGNLPLIFEADKYKEVKHYEIIQETGDALFVPSGWHHQVVNELNTISVNHNWINACNINIVWQALQHNLQQVEHQIEDLKDTPDYYSDCQLMLKSVFGMNFTDFVNFLCYMAKKRLDQLHKEPEIGLGNYILGNNLIKFDLKQILLVIKAISSHPVSPYVLTAFGDTLINIENSISKILKEYNII